ncbi:MAG: glycoside hydrolase family 127 protein [Planctomycetota bacterium]|nr:glycoside hydrolase family 127 protein [Planctomycetota bacterium]
MLVRYHNPLHGTKDTPQCHGTCCECSVVGMLSKLPEYIYSTDKDGLWVNLFAASAITWNQDSSRVTVTQATSFPYASSVRMTVSCANPVTMTIRIRVPSWATDKVDIVVNGELAATGAPGSYVSVRRTWANNDAIEFTLPLRSTTPAWTKPRVMWTATPCCAARF